MKRPVIFAGRVIKEILRDPLSYIFCLGFPIVMLVIMSVVNGSIPPQAGMTIFRIDNLAGGIIIFGDTFIMLFTALTVSKDRSGSFLLRLFASPMRSSDFTIGYFLPMGLLALCQAAITLTASYITSLITGVELTAGGLLTALLVSVPCSLMYISTGFLFGTLFSDKSAPGMCSVIISLGSFLGSVWFDAEGTGGTMLKICRALPFIYSTKAVRSATVLDLSKDSFLVPLAVVLLTGTVLFMLSAYVFGKKMRSDLS